MLRTNNEQSGYWTATAHLARLNFLFADCAGTDVSVRWRPLAVSDSRTYVHKKLAICKTSETYSARSGNFRNMLRVVIASQGMYSAIARPTTSQTAATSPRNRAT
jgi:hypothetical protein